MPLHYRRDMFEKWRLIAVTRKDDMRLGDTFYSNTGETFTLMAFCTMEEYLDRMGLKTGIRMGHVAISTHGRFYALSDFNVDASYTPWLLFRDAATCRACQISMPVTIDTGQQLW